MNFISISDVHHNIGQSNTRLILENYCKFAIDNQVENIFFLGDIFDFLVGSSASNQILLEEFIKIFQPIFQKNSTVHYFSGNHDFHLEKILYDVASKENVKIKYSKKGSSFVFDGNKIYMSHGDDDEIENNGYKIFKSIINNTLMEKFSNWKHSDKIVQAIGNRMLDKSMAKPSRYDTENGNVKDKFRRTAEAIYKKENADFIVLGHSHVKDIHSNSNYTYINNGFVPKTKSFVYYRDGNIDLIHFKP